jgi:hypothetical protein
VQKMATLMKESRSDSPDWPLDGPAALRRAGRR